MASDPKSVAIAVTWLDGLADLISPGREHPPRKTLVSLATQLLEGGLSSGAFVSASARACALGEFFPGYDALNARLSDWWIANRPGAARALLPSESGSENLNATDQAWLDFFYRRKPEIAADEADFRARGVWRDHADDPYSPAYRLASLVRQCSPAAWSVISGSDGSRREPSWEEIAEVKRRAASAIQAMRGDDGPRGMSPSRQMEAMPSQPPPSRAAPLSPELLAERRQAAGIPSKGGIVW